MAPEYDAIVQEYVAPTAGRSHRLRRFGFARGVRCRLASNARIVSPAASPSIPRFARGVRCLLASNARALQSPAGVFGQVALKGADADCLVRHLVSAPAAHASRSLRSRFGSPRPRGCRALRAGLAARPTGWFSAKKPCKSAFGRGSRRHTAGTRCRSTRSEHVGGVHRNVASSIPSPSFHPKPPTRGKESLPVVSVQSVQSVARPVSAGRLP